MVFLLLALGLGVAAGSSPTSSPPTTKFQRLILLVKSDFAIWKTQCSHDMEYRQCRASTKLMTHDYESTSSRQAKVNHCCSFMAAIAWLLDGYRYSPSSINGSICTLRTGLVAV